MNFIKLIAIWFFISASGIAMAQAPQGFTEMANVTDFKASVKETIGNIKTVQADFSQEKHLSIFSKTIDSEGSMSYKSPGKLKWTYTTPYNYGILIKDQKISISDDGKVNTFDLSSSEKFSEINELILNSITGKILDDERFNTTYFENNKFQLVVLKPKDTEMSNFIAEIHIYLEPNKKQVSQIKIVESASDYTLITFSNQILNEPIPDGLFNTP